MPLKSQHDSITESSFELAECMYTRQKKKKKKKKKKSAHLGFLVNSILTWNGCI